MNSAPTRYVGNKGEAMKKKLVCLAFIFAMGSTWAMTEDELVEAARASQAAFQAGKISELDHNKQVYKLVADMPATYKDRAENLRLFGARIDTLEAVEAGKITREKGQRDLIQQDANYQAETLRQEAEASRRTEAARAQERMRKEAIARQEEAQRRALAVQILQNRPAPVQITPYQMSVPKTCHSTPTLGGGFETICR